MRPVSLSLRPSGLRALSLSAAALLCALCGEIGSLRAADGVYINKNGTQVGTNPADKVGFYGTTAAQAANTAQAAITDSTTGTAGTTLAATVGVETIVFPLDLPSVGNANIVTAYVPGYAFKVIKTQLVVNKPVTTGSKAATIFFTVNGNATVGGVITANSTNCTPIGGLVAGTAVTGNNTGTATQNLTITGSSVTAFVEGSASLHVTIQNVDTANAFASIAALQNAQRTAEVGMGIMKGGP